MNDGPRHYRELAQATGTHAPSLNRVLRLLASAGVFAEEADGKFALTPIGACLRSDGPGSARAGRQRSEEEFRSLYQTAGFKLTRIIPTPARVSLIEGACA